MITLEDVRDQATISVREAGELLSIGRDAAYRAAASGDLPVLRLGRTLRVPVPRLLGLLGVEDTPRAPGIDPVAEPTSSTKSTTVMAAP